MIRAIGAALVLAAAAADAQGLKYSPLATETCLSAATDSVQMRSCIGSSANACMSATPDGSTTRGMSDCLNLEWQFWDDRLNEAYRRVLTRLVAKDAELDEIGSAAPRQSEAFRDMQRAWIGFRDAKCLFVRSEWGSGTGSGPASVACVMSETGEQALYLEIIEGQD